MNVRATVERLGREHVGKSWWVDLAEALVQEFEPVVAERDRLRTEIEKPADVLNARDAVTESDTALWEKSPGDALAHAISSILDDLNTMIEAAHCEARRAVAAERERNGYRSELGFIAEHAASAHHARLRARAALDRGTP